MKVNTSVQLEIDEAFENIGIKMRESIGKEWK